MNSIENIIIIGSGNVATSLAIMLHKHNFTIKQVYSKTLKHAKLLADRVDACFTDTPEMVFIDADLYIIAVSDNEIESVLKQINFEKNLVIHTSGSTPISIFEGYLNNCGVFYPLQTFSKSKIIDDFSNIPIFIESSNSKNTLKLTEFAHKLSNNVFEINTKQRLAIHISAVFACNFVNHMLTIATDIMQKNNLDKQWIEPLIIETISKALKAENPKTVQTGPAIRNDKITLERHKHFLKNEKNNLNIYKILSDSIISYNESKYE